MRLLLPLTLVACSGKVLDTSTGDSSVDSMDTAGSGGGFDTSHDGTCSTDSEWTDGNNGSSRMNPGQGCITCHDRGEGPDMSLAGTVQGAIHDPNNCNGIKDVVVHVTDANGNVTDLNTNAAGNFYTNDHIATPYTIVLEYNGVTREMSGSQTSGDCATCHSEQGDKSAPGRIVVPE